MLDPNRWKYIENNWEKYDSFFREFLWEKHRDTYVYLTMGHMELIDDKLMSEFEVWLKERGEAE